MLAREVLRMRGTISREHPWEVMPDLYFYRDPEEVSRAPCKQIFVRIILTLALIVKRYNAYHLVFISD